MSTTWYHLRMTRRRPGVSDDAEEWGPHLSRAIAQIRERSSLPVTGASEADIAAVQRAVGKPLPAAYAAFLREIGRDLGDFLVGDEAACARVTSLQTKSSPLLGYWRRGGRTRAHVIFLRHYDDHVLLLPLGRGDDPPVLQVGPRYVDAVVVSDRFTTWLTCTVALELPEPVPSSGPASPSSDAAPWRARVDRFVSGALATPERGCTPSEIARLARRLRRTLPPAYVAWLRAMGRVPADSFRGSDLDIGCLERLQHSAGEMITEVGGSALPHDAHVFFGHHDYQFLWFRCDGDADPAVLLVNTSDGISRPLGVTFSGWLEEWEASEPRSD